MKIYAGAPAAARHYVEAGCGRPDDYYLAEGTGLARRFTATDGHVQELAPLTGDTYETWVAGHDPDTDEPRGLLRTDEHAVRFAEVVVNGPKTWSLAAALQPDIAAAYEAAQDRAATQIISWLAEHATTRVGPRGGQVQVPVEVLEAATVRHYTSRARDPHWHLHLQLLSRVFAAGKWRGLHTVGIRDSLNAINGIGHAAMACDPELNAAFAAHGYTKDSTGELLELVEYVGPFSARHAQIARNVDRYEQEWTAAHPGEHPGRALRRAWDARAWADGRPDKVTPQPGASLTERWRAHFAALGYRDPVRPVALTTASVGALDRDAGVHWVLGRLAAGRSAWNAADIRGEAEQLIAASGIVAEAAVRGELAEDLAARALVSCVPLLQGDGVPEHIRAWTSRPVLEVEAELTVRLAARGTARDTVADPLRAATPSAKGLDTGQAAAAADLAGDRPLLVVEGAAGAGKTTILAAARHCLDARGRRLMVVTPTLKAAKVAAAEVGAAASSAAWLAFQHGWRWNASGTWTRLTVGQPDPTSGVPYAGPSATAELAAGGLLVIDEAGMLDQDTACALLTVADEAGARIALLGDRHQLPAVGRGGVLDLAAAAAGSAGCLALDGVHRFTRMRPDGRRVPDREYADLTLAMRAGADPGSVFDALAARGQIRIHPTAQELQETLAGIAAHSPGVAVVADTREQAASLSAVIRDRLVADRRVDDTQVAITRAGQRIGTGDRIATRRNDPDLDIANRDTWSVTAVGRRGLLVTGAADQTRALPADYVIEHVELAYASTAHGAQGDTVESAHLVIGEHTGAGSAYVGMTRGRTASTAHLIATDLAEAREQWLTVFARDRADLGPRHAAKLAAGEAARYATGRPLAHALADLHQAWTDEQRCLDRLTLAEARLGALRAVVAAERNSSAAIAVHQAREQEARRHAEQARKRVEAVGAVVTRQAGAIRQALLDDWDRQRPAARNAAQVVLDGPGPLGFKRAAVTRARAQLDEWIATWRPVLSGTPTNPGQIVEFAAGPDDRGLLWDAFAELARSRAEHAHPSVAQLRATAQAAIVTHEQAARGLADARRRQEDHRAQLTPSSAPAGQLSLAELEVPARNQELTDVRARIGRLMAEPTLLTQPADRLHQERAVWQSRHDSERSGQRSAGTRPTIRGPGIRPPRVERARKSATPAGVVTGPDR